MKRSGCLGLVAVLVAVSVRPVSAVVFVHLSDTHVNVTGNGRFCEEGIPALRRAVEAIRIIKPDFVLCTGDITESADEASMKAYRTEIEKAGVPVYTVQGNHDRTRLPDRFNRTVGPTHHVFDIDGCRFVGRSPRDRFAPTSGRRRLPNVSDVLGNVGQDAVDVGKRCVHIVFCLTAVSSSDVSLREIGNDTLARIGTAGVRLLDIDSKVQRTWRRRSIDPSALFENAARYARDVDRRLHTDALVAGTRFFSSSRTNGRINSPNNLQ